MDDQDKPPPVDYLPPSGKPPGGKSLESRRFLLGLLGGTALSGLVWLFVFKLSGSKVDSGGNGVFAAMIGLPILKVAVAIGCLIVRGWRSCGAGILLSLILGALIFFGLCATTMG